VQDSDSRVLLEQLSNQTTEMVRHVAEIRSSYTLVEELLRSILARLDQQDSFDKLDLRIETLQERFDKLETQIGARLNASTEHLMDRFEQLAELVGGELLRARLRQQSSLTEYQEGVEAHIEELSSRIARLEVLREN
jgi:predicted nuclease with TOPRIM domain